MARGGAAVVAARKRPAGVEPLPTADGFEPTPVGDGLDRLLRQLGGPAAGTLTALHGRWPELVGEQIAAHARPVSLRDGRLTVVVDDPAWASQLRWLEPRLTGRLSEVLGEPVERLDLRVEAC